LTFPLEDCSEFGNFVITLIQVLLSPQSKEKSAFVTPFGQFEFTVMTFGMKTSAATFLRLMDKLLNDLENTVA